MEEFYLYINEEQYGPYSFEQVKQMLAEYQITKDTYIWRDGFENWVTINELKDFTAGSANKIIEPAPVYASQTSGSNQSKNTINKSDTKTKYDTSAYKTHTISSKKKEKTSKSSSSLILPIIVISVIAVMVGHWYFFKHKGLPVLEGSYINKKDNFAVLPPKDWVNSSDEDFKKTMELLKGRINPAMEQAMSSNDVTVTFSEKDPGTDGFAATMNVVTGKTGIPDITEKDKNDIIRAVTSEMKKMVEDFKIEKTEIIECDRLKSFKIVYTANFKVMVSSAVYSKPNNNSRYYVNPRYRPKPKLITPATYETYPMKWVQVLIPGNNKFYVITGTHSKKKFAEYEPVFDKMIDSFRVLKRPPVFNPKGSIITAALKGGGKQAGIVILLSIIGWVFSRRD